MVFCIYYFLTCKIHNCYKCESLQSNFSFLCLDVRWPKSLSSPLCDLWGLINLETEQDASVSTMGAIVVCPKGHRTSSLEVTVDGCCEQGWHPLVHTSKALSVVTFGVCSDWSMLAPYCILNILSVTSTNNLGHVVGSFNSPLSQLGSPHCCCCSVAK